MRIIVTLMACLLWLPAIAVAADQNHGAFWLEAQMKSGTLQLRQTFEAYVPAKAHSPSPSSTIVEREPVLVDF